MHDSYGLINDDVFFSFDKIGKNDNPPGIGDEVGVTAERRNKGGWHAVSVDILNHAHGKGHVQLPESGL